MAKKFGTSISTYAIGFGKGANSTNLIKIANAANSTNENTNANGKYMGANSASDLQKVYSDIQGKYQRIYL